MSFLDLLAELRSPEADPEKAARAMKFLGWLCLAGGLWNFLLPQFAPFEQSGFRLPASFPWLALAAGTLIGLLSLLSVRGIRERETWGKRTAQAAVVLLLLGLVSSPLLIPEVAPIPLADAPFLRNIFFVFALIVAAQFGLPAYFGLRYLGRLPVRDPFAMAPPPTAAPSPSPAAAEVRYKDSPFPFGILGTFALLLAGPMLLIFFLIEKGGESLAFAVFPLSMLFIFVGPVLFNLLPSPFQKSRRVLAAFTGGGSTFLFNGSWPFFRLLVYADALEVRVMFHRFLIPHEKMDEPPAKVGFFTTGLLIRSDLPGVPSRIRFSGFGMKKILREVAEARKRFFSTREEEKSSEESGRPGLQSFALVRPQ